MTNPIRTVREADLRHSLKASQPLTPIEEISKIRQIVKDLIKVVEQSQIPLNHIDPDSNLASANSEKTSSQISAELKNLQAAFKKLTEDCNKNYSNFIDQKTPDTFDLSKEPSLTQTLCQRTLKLYQDFVIAQKLQSEINSLKKEYQKQFLAEHGFKSLDQLQEAKRAQYQLWQKNRGFLNIKALSKSSTCSIAKREYERLNKIYDQSYNFHRSDSTTPYLLASPSNVIWTFRQIISKKLEYAANLVNKKVEDLNNKKSKTEEISATAVQLKQMQEDYFQSAFVEKLDLTLAKNLDLTVAEKNQLRTKIIEVGRELLECNLHKGNLDPEYGERNKQIHDFISNLYKINSDLAQELSLFSNKRPWEFNNRCKQIIDLATEIEARTEIDQAISEVSKLRSTLRSYGASEHLLYSASSSLQRSDQHLPRNFIKEFDRETLNILCQSPTFIKLVGAEKSINFQLEINQKVLERLSDSSFKGDEVASVNYDLMNIIDPKHSPIILMLAFGSPQPSGCYPLISSDFNRTPIIVEYVEQLKKHPEITAQLEILPGAAELVRIISTNWEAVKLARHNNFDNKEEHPAEVISDAKKFKSALTSLAAYYIEHGDLTEFKLAQRLISYCNIVDIKKLILPITTRLNREKQTELYQEVLDLCQYKLQYTNRPHEYTELAVMLIPKVPTSTQSKISNSIACHSFFNNLNNRDETLSEKSANTIANLLGTSVEKIQAADLFARQLRDHYGKHRGYPCSPFLSESNHETQLANLVSFAEDPKSREALLNLAASNIPFDISDSNGGLSSQIKYSEYVCSACAEIKRYLPRYEYRPIKSGKSDRIASPYNLFLKDHLNLDSLTSLVQDLNNKKINSEDPTVISFIEKIFTEQWLEQVPQKELGRAAAIQFIQACQQIDQIKNPCEIIVFCSVLTKIFTDNHSANFEDAIKKAQAICIIASNAVDHRENLGSLTEISPLFAQLPLASLNSITAAIPSFTTLTSIFPKLIKSKDLSNVLPELFSNKKFFEACQVVTASNNKVAIESFSLALIELSSSINSGNILEAIKKAETIAVICNQSSNSSKKLTDLPRLLQTALPHLIKLPVAELQQLQQANYPAIIIFKVIPKLLENIEKHNLFPGIYSSLPSTHPLISDDYLRNYLVDSLCDEISGARLLLQEILSSKLTLDPDSKAAMQTVNLFLLANCLDPNELEKAFTARAVDPTDPSIEQKLQDLALANLKTRYSENLLNNFIKEHPEQIFRLAEILLTYEVSLNKFGSADKIPILRVLVSIELMGAEKELRARNLDLLKNFNDHIAEYVPIESEQAAALDYLRSYYSDTNTKLILPSSEFTPEEQKTVLAAWNNSDLRKNHITSKVDNLDRAQAVAKELRVLHAPGHISNTIKIIAGIKTDPAGKIQANPLATLGLEAKQIIAEIRILSKMPINTAELANTGEAGREDLRLLEHAEKEGPEVYNDVRISMLQSRENRLAEIKAEQNARNHIAEIRKLLLVEEKLVNAVNIAANAAQDLIPHTQMITLLTGIENPEKVARNFSGATIIKTAVVKELQQVPIDPATKAKLEKINTCCDNLLNAHQGVSQITGAILKYANNIHELLVIRAKLIEQVYDGNALTKTPEEILELFKQTDPSLAFLVEQIIKSSSSEEISTKLITTLAEAKDLTFRNDLQKLISSLKPVQEEALMSICYQAEPRLSRILNALVNQCLDYRSTVNSVGNCVYNMALGDPDRELVVAYDHENLPRVNAELFIARVRFAEQEFSAVIADQIYTPDRSLPSLSKIQGYLQYAIMKANQVGLPLVIPSSMQANPKVVDDWMKETNFFREQAYLEKAQIQITPGPTKSFYIETINFSHYDEPTWVTSDSLVVIPKNSRLATLSLTSKAA